MEFTASASNNNNNSNMVSSKTTEVDTDAPPRIQPSKPIPTTNGVLKRHHLHPHPHPHHQLISPPVAAVIYKDCLRNHAASIGGYAVDGCGEFMPSLAAKSADPTSLKCDACGCHRNFHRREPEESPSATHTHLLEFQPHHRHHPPPPPPPHRNHSHSPADSPSPPPISSAFYPSAPHMLLALSGGGMQPETSPVMNASPAAAAHGRGSNGRKRFRTKFSPDQKDKMLRFAETVGWKMQKRDDDSISRFCSDVGVDRGVFKVWMHNNKNALAKKDNTTTNGGGVRNNLGIADHEDDGGDEHPCPDHGQHQPNYGGMEVAEATNGSSSSS